MYYVAAQLHRLRMDKTGHDGWLTDVERELADCGVEPACAEVVLRALAADDHERPSAVELLQTEFLRSDVVVDHDVD